MPLPVKQCWQDWKHFSPFIPSILSSFTWGEESVVFFWKAVWQFLLKSLLYASACSHISISGTRSLGKKDVFKDLSTIYKIGHGWAGLSIEKLETTGFPDNRFSSIHSVVSNSFWPPGLQHSKPPCPSPAPRVYTNSCPSSQWCHPVI